MTKATVYSEADISKRLAAELPRWRYERGAIRRAYRTTGWKGTLMAVNAVGYLAEAAWHHPDLAVSYAALEVALSTHDAGGITDKDFALAGAIEALLTPRAGGPPAEFAILKPD